MAPRRRQSWALRFAPAGAVLVVGLAISIGVGSCMYRQALRADAARFRVETEYLAGTIEQSMERYEERLARLADYCSLFEEMPQQIWYFRREVMTDVTGNMPAVIHLVYCPKVKAADF